MDSVLNLDCLYSSTFHYPFPRERLESFFIGKGFDYQGEYTPQERQNLENDVNEIYRNILGYIKVEQTAPVVVITAGPPGSGKTTLIRQIWQDQGGIHAYVCPDDICLRQMTLTYQAELKNRLAEHAKSTFVSEEEEQASERKLRRELFDKWRPASNAAKHALAGRLMLERRSFYFGTTCTETPFTVDFFQCLETLGYTIELLHVSASDKVRAESIQRRNKVFVQVTEDDILTKGDLVALRIKDTHLLANVVKFFYRKAVEKSAVLGATWTRGQKTCLAIEHPQSYAEIKKIHNAVCTRLGRPDILWEKLLEE